MTILTMTATFGRLENETLTLAPGLNLLERPNEGGKSTWCAFLRAMFYGLESRKGGALSERNRYTPWSGAPMAGTVDLLWRGEAVTLRRFPKGQDPFGGFEAVYTGTREAVPGLTAANVGEQILGVSKEVFQRTAFIPQGGMAVDKSADLERRIAALATSGEEDVSFSQTERRLKDWRNARRANRSVGSIPKLQGELDELAQREHRAQRARDRVREVEETLAALERDRGEVTRDLSRHTAQQARAYKDRCEKAKAEAAQAEAELRRREQERDAVLARLDAPGEPSPASSGGRWVPVLSGAALAVLFVILALLVGPAVLFLPLAAACVLAGVALTLRLAQRSRDRQREARHQEEEKRAALRRQAETRVTEARWALDAAQKVLAATLDRGEPGEVPPVDMPPTGDYEEDRRKLQKLQSSIALCKEMLSQAQGEVLAAGGGDGLRQEAAELKEKLKDQEEEYDALTLALEALTAANARLQQRFSPAVNAAAGRYLSRLTGGRYEAITFDRDFSAAADAGSGPRPAWALSQGTADQVYLALRLAVCELALPREDPAPLVLDDALVRFDDTRLARALAVLEELAASRQILLFTCQDREGRLRG